MERTQRLPVWFRQSVPRAATIKALRDSFDELGLNTVCRSSHCPNLGQCWEKGVATFMILGDVCTRRCRFCAVSNGLPKAVNPDEPKVLAQAVKKLGLEYIVITSVTRDDLEDKGAGHFSKTIIALRLLNPEIKIEILIPDFSADVNLIKIVAQARPEVIAHNIETVRRLTAILRPQADYDRSLSVLRMIKESNPQIVVKSGLMLGLGETADEIDQTMKDLFLNGCDILTIGQYLSPSRDSRHVRVGKFISLQEFADYKDKALSLGFKYVLSGPLVRSSYLAKEAYQGCLERKEGSLGKVLL
ncbi:MAG: lipoyl synthase [Candidatus Omnitrophica bacterium]|nr:lipoyl synthase [Candidatus Omnitrophota bacterium]